MGDREKNVVHDDYNDAISSHYAAYRPPLHQALLAEFFQTSGRGEIDIALDIGCGTGVSSRALIPYCKAIIAVDPSIAMIEQAILTTEPWANIAYCIGDGEALNIPDQQIDLVTFAGSLNYAKSPSLLKELKRVCKPEAHVIVYDFEVHLDEWLLCLGIQMPETAPMHYDHEINFDDCELLRRNIGSVKTVALDVSAQNLAHVLFSSTGRYNRLQAKFQGEDAFHQVVKRLDRSGLNLQIKATTYLYAYTQVTSVNQ
ncbi:class I SAM-dependent methyltransferase [Vibrio sp. SM6]|uniref:Class I SAM-dependent methyltransferase n=1 Tax=Vibrio agarilyticus TaxID=2726741 RepID=A0A7X8TSF1_9VIBR|nr:class I SAM-dependent methyltransferase [Vibrio agarilyticus]NLS13408.1 class I SAM-dependent methyltransferase [Vibrio agarilyticus]